MLLSGPPTEETQTQKQTIRTYVFPPIPFANSIFSSERNHMANPDSTTTSLPVSVTWTAQATQCVPPAVIEALRGANFRIDLPNSIVNPGTFVLTSSSFADNIFRVDSEGAGYVPGVVKYVLSEQVVTLTEATAVGEVVEVAFSAPGVSDLANAIVDMTWDIQPPGSPINIGPKRVSNGQVIFDIIRVDTGIEAPDTLPIIVVRGSGKLLIFPSPSPA
jgi:hypothetical protein